MFNIEINNKQIKFDFVIVLYEN
ncbi:uncharacterized protein METZ01_LOCUS229105 [marine metagenome]|uniref:Uncharacterized protein n=1 Tax=marine metagenome TaxID=408172 RepID=A0A382GQ17_9ZZZZ